MTGTSGHRSILKYRPQFDSIQEHNDCLIGNFKALVKKRDVTYFLGDMIFSYQSLELIQDLPGRKILVMGNHDLEERTLDTKLLYTAFEDVRSLVSKGGIWYSHAPIHPAELRNKYNLHGHTHYSSIGDDRYYNVCPEVNDFKPIDVAIIKETMRWVKQA